MERCTFVYIFGLLAVFSVVSAYGGVTMDFVIVGNPGNLPDSNGLGAVSYGYKIGKYEVTIGQYVDFLNAVAKSDPYGLWDPRMETGAYGWVPGFIARTGTPGNYSYQVMDAAFLNRPVWWVDWWDAARFANWMHNGQPRTGVSQEPASRMRPPLKTVLTPCTDEPESPRRVSSESPWLGISFQQSTNGIRQLIIIGVIMG